MPLYAGKYAICTFLQNMRNMLRSHDRYKPVSLLDGDLTGSRPHDLFIVSSVSSLLHHRFMAIFLPYASIFGLSLHVVFIFTYRCYLSFVGPLVAFPNILFSLCPGKVRDPLLRRHVSL